MSDRRNGVYKRKYGITVDDYEEMLYEQDGVCAICHREPSEERLLDIDHDHRTSKVRGLLCNACNQGLGMFKDSPSLLKEAIDYLENPR